MTDLEGGKRTDASATPGLRYPAQSSHSTATSARVNSPSWAQGACYGRSPDAPSFSSPCNSSDGPGAMPTIRDASYDL